MLSALKMWLIDKISHTKCYVFVLQMHLSLPYKLQKNLLKRYGIKILSQNIFNNTKKLHGTSLTWSTYYHNNNKKLTVTKEA